MDYLEYLRRFLPCTLETLREYTSPEVKEYVRLNADEFKGRNPRDKGGLGKQVEFYIFGRLPNPNRNPDTELGDIKSTHIKKCRDGYCAKERLTLTNCGSTTKPETLQHLLGDLEQNKLYPKIRTGILFVFFGDEIRYIVRYDIEEIGKEIILNDYRKIQDRVRTNTVSQSGQTYLHIHPHGSKNSKTRALGFTNKFVTRIIAHYCDLELRTCGRSLVF